MKDERLETFHLNLMNEVLPVGFGIFERVQKEGLKKLLEDLNSKNDYIGDLRSEGEPLASSLRDKLDGIRPGLGNPAIKVDVKANTSESCETLENIDSLSTTLNNIEKRLDLLNDYLDKTSTNIESSS